MIDIQFVREHPEFVTEKSNQKGYSVDVDALLATDEQRRQLLTEVEAKRAERNTLTAAMKGSKPTDEQIRQGKELKETIQDLESKLQPIEEEYNTLLKSVPNMPVTDVPVGTSEDDNQDIKTWGDKPHFDFKIKDHREIGEAKGWIDKERAAKVAGARFAYLKGDLVRLQWALMQFALDVLGDESQLKKIADEAGLTVSTKPFTPVLPPYLIQTELYDAMDRLEPREDRYKIEGEELWLQGSAEHVLGSMHANEILDADDIPLRYVGYATSFRKEAGTYGRDMQGIIRMHQFDKLEMESLTTAELSLEEHQFMVAIQEYLMQRLKLPYKLILKCTADIGKPNARGVDIDVWLPGQNKYRETHTADYMTDYQARRLQTKIRTESGTELVHTNDATVFSQRPLIAIIENYQRANGNVGIPEVLRPYMNNREEI